MEWMLTQTIQAGKASGAIDERSLKRVAVDTTVMEFEGDPGGVSSEERTAHPTDS